MSSDDRVADAPESESDLHSLRPQRCCTPNESQGFLHSLVKFKLLRCTGRENSRTKPYLSRQHVQSPEQRQLTSTSVTR